MVWDAISFDSRVPLVVIRGTFTAQRYVDDILRTVLIPFLLHYLSLFVSKIMPDHIRHVLLSYSLSNPSLVSQIARYLSNRACLRYEGKEPASTGNDDHLARQSEQIWQEILQDTIRVPYQSMPRHVTACIQARGGSRPY
ncbi:transposable element Tcb1 transposase [Trichonephila clavipes]|nr:transposable element Tcb1 transposase [Trichonephila clavipes]